MATRVEVLPIGFKRCFLTFFVDKKIIDNTNFNDQSNISF